MSKATANEQLMLELINRARLDPAGEAARFGIDLNKGLAAGTISSASKQPLAMNDLLINAARGHSQWMINTDTFSHTGSGGSNPGTRMKAAGYLFSGSWSWGENLAWQGTTGTPNLTSMIVNEHQSLFLSAGHRVNMLNANYREVGIGQVGGVFTYGGKNYNASMVTQDYAKSGTKLFVLGVAYNDTSGDNFYSVGEGRGGVQMTLQPISGGTAASTVGGSAGGYEAGAAAGTYNITFSGGGLPNSMTVQANLTQNLKLDVMNGDTIMTSGSLTLGTGANKATMLGIDSLTLTGNGANNVLTGNKGANTISGMGGNDTIRGAAGNDTVSGGAGDDIFVFGKGDGTDRITDFTPGGTVDEIKLTGFAGVTSFATLMALGHDYGTYTQFDFSSGEHLRLDNVHLASLTASDFLFG